MKPILLTLFAALQICTKSPLWAQDSAAVLKPDALRTYVAAFNGQRPDDTSVDLPSDGSITAIRNDQSATYPSSSVPTKTSKKPTTFAGGLIVSTSGTPPPGSSSRSSCRRSAGVNSTTPSIARSDTNSTKGAGFATRRSSTTILSFTSARAAMPGARPNSIPSGSPTPSTPATWSPVTSLLSRGCSMA